MIQWNGSYLGSYSKEVIISEEKYKNARYWNLQLPNDVNFTCLAIPFKNALPCIIDELKSLFGPLRIGTHHITIDNHHYILTTGTKAEYQVLDSYEGPYSLLLTLQIQEILAFREIIGLTSNTEKSIIIRDKTPISVHEINLTMPRLLDGQCVLPSSILSKWFPGKDDLRKAILRIVRPNLDDPTETLANLRNVISDIINRVDKDYIWYASYLVKRIAQRI